MPELLLGDCIEVMKRLPAASVDVVFADPPYNLSNGGGTCHGGQWVCVDKGEWDKSRGLAEDHAFNLAWLAECKRVLKRNGTIWVSGTYHAIYSIGFALQTLEYKILNDICWFKPSASPNLSGRYFTASHETLIWAARDKSSRHTFNYEAMKAENGGLQMRSMWPMHSTPQREKTHGKHPTQKPLSLLRRIIRASTKPSDLILDPFCGSGTTGVAALELGRRFIGIDLSPEYLQLAERRVGEVQMSLVREETVPYGSGLVG
jgi:site-specific DNA-methyltransferase (adenine-specific)